MENYTAVMAAAHSIMPHLFEYLLVVSPSAEVFKSVMEIKQSFSGKYNQSIAIKTKPHITVANFLAMERMEDTLIRWMQRAVAELESFVTQLNNYSGFPGHTIFLRVQNPDPFRELIARLKVIASYIKEYDCPSPKFIQHPHMSIARSLSVEVYEKAIREYAHEEFEATFPVQQLLLLRKQHGNKYEKYAQVAVLNLKQHSPCN
jgi:2'-5' RNA ligase